MSNERSFHNCKKPISYKIRSLLVSLTTKPSEYDQITPKIEYWIEYVLREHLTTVDELVEGVSYVAWEDGGSYTNVGRFFKEFRDVPHRSEQVRSFVHKRSPCFLMLPGYALTLFAGSRSLRWDSFKGHRTVTQPQAVEGTASFAQHRSLVTSSSTAC